MSHLSTVPVMPDITATERYDRICWKGDWTLLPQKCSGNVEVWDQTIGCPECGMNLWYLPDYGCWPAWDPNEPPVNWWQAWKINTDAYNPYEPYANLFFKLHPFQFDDCHDPGDEDRDPNPWLIGL